MNRASWNAHFGYLKYVLLHKLYVFRAGLVINGYSLPWLWRLLVHDLSKFSRAEWGPYVRRFYGEPEDKVAAREIAEHYAEFPDDPAMSPDTREHLVAAAAATIIQRRSREFNAAWLHHIHANPHHWQHWILHEDSGKTIVLVPPNAVVNEMIADWIGAGAKVLRRPTMAQCVAETIGWYVNIAAPVVQLRADVREHVEMTLHALARWYKLDALAFAIQGQRAQGRVTITLGGRR